MQDAAVPIADARRLAGQCGISPTIAKLLIARGYADSALAQRFLQPKLSELTKPDGMVDRDVAVDRIARAVRSKERIAIFGDYDVDGTTSAVILSQVIRALGGNVNVCLANRYDGGYGLSDRAVDRLLENRPQILITCDCGSTDHARIERVMRSGIDVIVIDHHRVPSEPLPALAFLNPNRPDCGFPFKDLSSAGLAFSVAAALRTRLDAALDMRLWLDLVALGTIADVVPLHGDNRMLARAGLLAMAGSTVRPGIRALREVSEKRPAQRVSGFDVAFRLAPRINAPGRLGDPRIALDLLNSNNDNEARAFAAKLEHCNQERRLIEQRVTQEAIAQAQHVYANQTPRCVVVANEQWPVGVVGITAARLVETFHCPAVVIGWEGDIGRGSARAPEGFHLYDAFSACCDHLLGFGGHKAAAGLSIAKKEFEKFRAALWDSVPTHWRCGDSSRPPRRVDAIIDGVEWPVPPADDLWLLEPMGAANQEPKFLLQGARVVETRKIGERFSKLKIEIGNECISSFAALADEKNPRGLSHFPERNSVINAYGSMRPDTWGGQNGVELHLEDWD